MLISTTCRSNNTGGEAMEPYFRIFQRVFATDDAVFSLPSILVRVPIFEWEQRMHIHPRYINHVQDQLWEQRLHFNSNVFRLATTASLNQWYGLHLSLLTRIISLSPHTFTHGDMPNRRGEPWLSC
jgi:hypothetical protein